MAELRQIADVDLDVACELICARACELTGADCASIELIDGERLVPAASSGTPLGGSASTIAVAIRDRDTIAGVLKVEAADARHFSGDQFATLEQLAATAAVQLSAEAVAGGSPRNDALTGLPNRRTFAERLAIEAARARRYSQPLALCIFDLHGLDAVNDKLGRRAGDEAVREVARILSSSRFADECFHLGGDQFALLMPQTTVEGAINAGARLSASVVAAGLCDGRISASFGAAAGNGDPVALQEHAAERLRLAKQRRATGRPRRPDGARPRMVAVVRGRSPARARLSRYPGSTANARSPGGAEAIAASIAAGERIRSITITAAPITPARSASWLRTTRRWRVASGSERW